jgi:hypothetical protein
VYCTWHPPSREARYFWSPRFLRCCMHAPWCSHLTGDMISLASTGRAACCVRVGEETLLQARFPDWATVSPAHGCFWPVISHSIIPPEKGKTRRRFRFGATATDRVSKSWHDEVHVHDDYSGVRSEVQRHGLRHLLGFPYVVWQQAYVFLFSRRLLLSFCQFLESLGVEFN